MPLWFRDPDMRLRLVNRAYVEAVGASSLEAVIEGQTELLEAQAGKPPAEIAREALAGGQEIERNAARLSKGARRRRSRPVLDRQSPLAKQPEALGLGELAQDQPDAPPQPFTDIEEW